MTSNLPPIQSGPAMGQYDDGVVIAWMHWEEPEFGETTSGLMGRLFWPIGVTFRDEFRIVERYTWTGGRRNNHSPRVAVTDNGRVGVVWRGCYYSSARGFRDWAFARFFDLTTGTAWPMTGDIELDVIHSSDMHVDPHPEICSSQNEFVVTWASAGSPGDTRAQRYDNHGQAVGPYFVAVENHATESRLGCLPDGSFVLVWSTADNSLFQVFDPNDFPVWPSSPRTLHAGPP